MTSNTRGSSTAGSVSSIGLKRIEHFTKVAPASDTYGKSDEGLLIVQGRIVKHTSGLSQFVVTVDPNMVDRKIAIMRMNDQIEGRTPRSNTVTNLKTQR